MFNPLLFFPSPALSRIGKKKKNQSTSKLSAFPNVKAHVAGKDLLVIKG
jgi:hypothetical protein